MVNKKLLKFILKIIGSISLISIGVFLFIFGEKDDSPGAQLLGLIIFIIGLLVFIKSKKKFSQVNN